MTTICWRFGCGHRCDHSTRRNAEIYWGSKSKNGQWAPPKVLLKGHRFRSRFTATTMDREALRQKVVCVRSESLREMVARNDITLHRDAETAKSLEKQSGPPPSTEVLGILLNRRWFETVPIWTNLEGSKWRERPPLSVWRMRAEIDRK